MRNTPWLALLLSPFGEEVVKKERNHKFIINTFF